MKLLLLILVVASIGLISGSQSGLRTKASVTAEHGVLKVNREWLEAFVRCDKSILNQIIDDDCILIDELGGVGNKRQFLDFMQSARPEDCSSKDLSLTEVRVRSFGSTSIVTGLMSDGPEGKRASRRYVSVFVLRNGRWRLVTFQNTRTPTLELGPIRPPK